MRNLFTLLAGAALALGLNLACAEESSSWVSPATSAYTEVTGALLENRGIDANTGSPRSAGGNDYYDRGECVRDYGAVACAAFEDCMAQYGYAACLQAVGLQ